MLDLVGDLGDDLRRVIADLRPTMLEDLGLATALADFCAEVAVQQPNLKVDFACSGLHARPDRDTETALFRVCQEALTNVVRHARAGRVEVRLICSYPQLILAVQDNGVGFRLSQRPRGNGRHGGGFGLLGMRERVTAVGGTLQIISTEGGGTRIRAEVPLVTKQEQSP